MTGDLHLSIPLHRHPTWPYWWPHSHMAERPLSRNGHNGHYGLTIYGHGCGQVGCLFKDMEKCRSLVEKSILLLRRTKSCKNWQLLVLQDWAITGLWCPLLTKVRGLSQPDMHLLLQLGQYLSHWQADWRLAEKS